MDIEYLLWLQSIREATGNLLTPLMVLVSFSAQSALLLVPIFIYWCMNKRAGLFLMFSTYVSYFAGNLIKLTLCVSRPFVQDPRIIPVGKADTSYSFPSGHTLQAAAVLGGLAVMTRKKAMWFSCLCVIGIILVGLSRNYLGLHTPQDVIAGAVVSFLVLWAVSALRDKENLLLISGLILCVAGIVYISVKPYPDDGFTLLDRAKNVYFYGGEIAGLIIGRIIERKYINFQPSGLNFKGIIIALAGLGLYCIPVLGMKYIANALRAYITAEGGYFVTGLAVAFYAVALWPLVIRKFRE